jgi:hypothetical protein
MRLAQSGPKSTPAKDILVSAATPIRVGARLLVSGGIETTSFEPVAGFRVFDTANG